MGQSILVRDSNGDRSVDVDAVSEKGVVLPAGGRDSLNIERMSLLTNIASSIDDKTRQRMILDAAEHESKLIGDSVVESNVSEKKEMPEYVSREIKAALTSLETNIPRFKRRKSQDILIATVARTLTNCFGDHRVAIIEAPTGTGKSIGYLLGSMAVAKTKEWRVVISTGTVALQEQLVNRDIPMLIEKSGIDFSFTLVKGRGRYVCNRNLAELSGSDSSQTGMEFEEGPMQGRWPFKPERLQMKCVTDMEEKLYNREWTGDLDAWDGEPIDDMVKSVITTDNAGCTGKACNHYRKCSYQKAKERMRSCNVIVANHDIVMSDVELGGAVLLPDPAKTVYIFDEAHHLPDVALKHAASTFELNGLYEFSKNFIKNYRDASDIAKSATESTFLVNSMKDRLLALRTFSEEFGKIVHEYMPSDIKPVMVSGGKEETTWRLTTHEAFYPLISRLCLDIMNDISEIEKAIDKVIGELKDLLKREKESGAGKGSNLNSIEEKALKAIRNLSFDSKLIGQAIKAISMYTHEDKKGVRPLCRYIVKSESMHAGSKRKKSGAKYYVSSSPLLADDIIKRGIIEKAAGVIFTSATVAANRSFDRYCGKVGLRNHPSEVRTCILESPFDYSANCLVQSLWMDNEPSSGEKYVSEVSSILNKIVNRDEGGTLVLFTARKTLMDVYSKLDEKLSSLVIKQGDFSKQEILDKHCDIVDKGKASIIFGLASFSEGVDLPGNLCRHVVLVKLPFSVPDSPVEAAYSEWLKSEGKNPFNEIAVPDACIKFTQACGRLIRSETDSGVITILDVRHSTKYYGRILNNSLPGYPMIENMVKIEHAKSSL